MSLRIYSTSTHRKELFEPARPGKVTLYLPGPAGVNEPLLNHMFAPVVFDVMKRYLQYKGYDVTWVVQLAERADSPNSTRYMECLSNLGIEIVDRFADPAERPEQPIDFHADHLAPPPQAVLPSVMPFISEQGADLLRYLILESPDRPAMQLSEQLLNETRRSVTLFSRLFERMRRILGEDAADSAPDMDQISSALVETEIAHFAMSVTRAKMRFLEAMDDAFDTAAALAVLGELANQINNFIDQHQIEREKAPDMIQAASAALVTLRKLAHIVGLFRREPAHTGEISLADRLLQILLDVRREAMNGPTPRLADHIDQSLSLLGIRV